jgi:hypothetical protein
LRAAAVFVTVETIGKGKPHLWVESTWENPGTVPGFPFTGLALVFVSKREHALKLALMAARKSAPVGEAVRFLKRAEQAIPPRDVPVIESMNIQLMVDRMMLRPLKDIPDPVRGAEIAVVKVLAQYGEDVEPSSRRWGRSQQ